MYCTGKKGSERHQGPTRVIHRVITIGSDSNRASLAPNSRVMEIDIPGEEGRELRWAGQALRERLDLWREVSKDG